MKRGYAVTVEEMTLGTCSVAAPILDHAGRPVAAVGAVVHSVRVEPGKLAPLIRLTAEGIAARLDATAHDAAGSRQGRVNRPDGAR